MPTTLNECVHFQVDEMLDRLGKDPQEATVIIRADGATQVGIVQEVIKVCQETGFEKFSLRAKQEKRQNVEAS